MINAVIIDEKDNVAVAIEAIAKGSEISFKLKDKTIKTITALDDITIYHKFYISFSIIRINTIHSSILRYRKTLILPRIYHD
ncbi:hypothetical protein [Clostridioides difficile]|uniref:hypothetical protein n=1 Tax=Clostridioides difficile TaxID=1496 RepID=UPI00254FA4D4|nr:hypothetical protein [Clostridioides difficile]MDL0361467.1 hypothetical protein [Clostridioides difficile]